MTDAEFMRAFETLTLPKETFRHADHVRAVWCCFRATRDFTRGSALFVGNFRRLVQSFGADAKYHETITWFYLARIFERMAEQPAELEWAGFCADNPDLLDREMKILKASYRTDIRQSQRARRVFLLPDGPASG